MREGVEVDPSNINRAYQYSDEGERIAQGLRSRVHCGNKCEKQSETFAHKRLRAQAWVILRTGGSRVYRCTKEASTHFLGDAMSFYYHN